MDGANGVGGQDVGWVSPEALKRDLQWMVEGLAGQFMGRSMGRGRGSLLTILRSR